MDWDDVIDLFVCVGLLVMIFVAVFLLLVLRVLFTIAIIAVFLFLLAWAGVLPFLWVNVAIGTVGYILLLGLLRVTVSKVGKSE